MTIIRDFRVNFQNRKKQHCLPEGILFWNTKYISNRKDVFIARSNGFSSKFKPYILQMTHRATKESPINTINWTVDDAIPHKYYYIIGMYYPVLVEFGKW
jgi:hypothetical protein